MSSRPSFLNVHGHGQLHGLWPHREAAGQLAQQTVVEQPRSTNIVYSSEVIHFRSRFVISEVNVAILVFPLLDWNIILLAYAFLFYSYRLYFISSGQLLLIFK